MTVVVHPPARAPQRGAICRRRARVPWGASLACALRTLGRDASWTRLSDRRRQARRLSVDARCGGREALSRRARSRRSIPAGRLLTRDQAEIVERTWRAVLPVGDTFAELFYGRLFALDPDLRRLFREDLVEQGRNLTAMLSVVAANMARPERIAVALRQLGRRHASYGGGGRD